MARAHADAELRAELTLARDTLRSEREANNDATERDSGDAPPSHAEKEEGSIGSWLAWAVGAGGDDGEADDDARRLTADEIHLTEEARQEIEATVTFEDVVALSTLPDDYVLTDIAATLSNATVRLLGFAAPALSMSISGAYRHSVRVARGDTRRPFGSQRSRRKLGSHAVSPHSRASRR